ncbi:hypothetical protein SAMN06265360_105230 [Haloechinothrix alba]|uniref:Transferase hexapeptide (Six repeat-containing protein) n=1 Tax=Haloechinothrix alba TaxID=664784 RepID=A0A238WAZ3_9PSEU|nr:hypothetical protein [Haloechinothrix alba]SNR42869.1 hypothetical protein SAMN06265360_105230 [Haloechinothrix alba]
MSRYALGEHEPYVHPTAFVHPDAVVIGSVVLGVESTVRTGAVIAASALVPEDFEVQPYTMALGVPARIREARVDPRGWSSRFAAMSTRAPVVAPSYADRFAPLQDLAVATSCTTSRPALA